MLATPRIALATAIQAYALDEDLPPLVAAFAELGVCAQPLAWDDPTVSWARFDAVLLRSTWNYALDRERFLDWCEHIERVAALHNPAATVRWNTDKRYLVELEAAGVAVVPTTYLSPGDAIALPDGGEFVVKPAVGAGARDARRYPPEQRAQAEAHARRLLDAGRAVLVQPYFEAVDHEGEFALVYIDGRFSHSIRKGAILQRDAKDSDALFAPETISPRQASRAEQALARKAIAAIPRDPPLYARVDLLPGADGPRLLELELAEPSLFFAHADGSATRLAKALLKRLGFAPARGKQRAR